MSSTSLPRSVPLQAASNLRDLGGWPVGGGRRVRFGRVFRSAALSRLTGSDQEAVRALGLRTTCDFRGALERERSPMRLDGADVMELPIEPTVGAGLRDILATGEATGEDLMTLLRRAYEAYALASLDQYRALFGLLLEDRRLPLLFHCSAGKDRTGFGAALVLTALGADWDTVMEDYLATNRLWRGDTVISHDLPPPLADILLRAHPELLEHAFTAIRRTDGSTDAYLARALRLDDAKRQRLRDLLTDDS